MSLEKHAIFGDSTEILLAISGKHHLPELLHLAVRLLAPDDKIALVRMSLVRPPEEGDCLCCPMAGECHHRERCLHLVASYGHARRGADRHWERRTGDFRRMPLAVRKTGHIAASGETVQIDDVSANSPWIVRPDWGTR